MTHNIIYRNGSIHPRKKGALNEGPTPVETQGNVAYSVTYCLTQGSGGVVAVKLRLLSDTPGDQTVVTTIHQTLLPSTPYILMLSTNKLTYDHFSNVTPGIVLLH